MVLLPLGLLSAWQWRESWSPWRTAAALMFVALPVGAAVWSVFHFDYLTVSELSPLDYAATQAAALWRLLAIVVVPIGQSVDHDYELLPFWLRYLALYGVVCLGCLAALGAATERLEGHAVRRLWNAAPQWKAPAFGVLWLLIAVAPRFLIRQPELISEHQLLIPMVGISLALAALVVPRQAERA